MAAQVTKDQAHAMDETMTYDAGQHARAFAAANLHLLEDNCGVVSESREQMLTRRISRRHNLLATAAMTEKLRRSLEEANDLDEQELCITQRMNADHSNRTAAELGRWLLVGVVGGALILVAAHFIAKNWGG